MVDDVANNVLRVALDLSPLDFNANDKYAGKVALTPKVRAAIRRMWEETTAQIKQQSYEPNKGHYTVEMWFTFGNERGDIDNAIKRTMDAVFTAISQAHPGRGINDGRVRHLIVHKQNAMVDGGKVGVVVEVRKWTR